MLDAAGWTIQHRNELNLGASLGVAVREFPLTPGEADYLQFVNRQAVGVVEAKPEGMTLSGVHDQSQKYMTAIPANLPHVQLPLPFTYESTGVETKFSDLRDPDPAQRRVFSFHRPETLREWIAQGDTLRKRLRYEIEKTVDASLKQARRLRQSILKRAFAGELVPQDPSDEPAEKLLERIRAQRELIGANQKSSRPIRPRRA